MSLITKQIDELRSYAKDRKGELAKLVSDAADTIELLSAKLSNSNMERSSMYYHGGWIPCSEPPDTDRNVFITRGHDDFLSCCIGHYDHGMKRWYEDRNWFAQFVYDELYWCEMPELPNCGADMNIRVGDPGANGT